MFTNCFFIFFGTLKTKKIAIHEEKVFILLSLVLVVGIDNCEYRKG